MIGLTPEQEDLRQVLRDLLSGRTPVVPAPGGPELAPVTDLWPRLAGELGLAGLLVPVDLGGAGGDWGDLVPVLGELGRVLDGGPFLSSAVLGVGCLLVAADDAAGAAYLPGAASGELLLSVADGEPGRGWGEAAIRTGARQVAGGWTLTGVKAYVLNGATADLLLVTARTADGVRLFGVNPKATGVRIRVRPALDLTRPLAEVTLDDAPADPLGPAGPQAAAGLGRYGGIARVALAAEHLGGAQRCLELSVEYARTRRQFGRAIGSFQAIKHRCADMLIAVESARSLVHRAVAMLGSDDPGREAATLMAAATAARVYRSAAWETIQILGGIGFSWEHEAHLHLRRAQSGEVMFEAPAAQMSRLADALGIPAT